MGRIIINNESQATDFQAMDLVRRVMDQGRISNFDKQYSYATAFNVEDNAGHHEYIVISSLNEKSDSFKVLDYKEG